MTSPRPATKDVRREEEDGQDRAVFRHGKWNSAVFDQWIIEIMSQARHPNKLYFLEERKLREICIARLEGAGKKVTTCFERSELLPYWLTERNIREAEMKAAAADAAAENSLDRDTASVVSDGTTVALENPEDHDCPEAYEDELNELMDKRLKEWREEAFAEHLIKYSTQAEQEAEEAKTEWTATEAKLTRQAKREHANLKRNYANKYDMRVKLWENNAIANQDKARQTVEDFERNAVFLSSSLLGDSNQELKDRLKGYQPWLTALANADVMGIMQAFIDQLKAKGENLVQRRSVQQKKFIEFKMGNAEKAAQMLVRFREMVMGNIDAGNVLEHGQAMSRLLEALTEDYRGLKEYAVLHFQSIPAWGETHTLISAGEAIVNFETGSAGACQDARLKQSRVANAAVTDKTDKKDKKDKKDKDKNEKSGEERRNQSICFAYVQNKMDETKPECRHGDNCTFRHEDTAEAREDTRRFQRTHDCERITACRRGCAFPAPKKTKETEESNSSNNDSDTEKISNVAIMRHGLPAPPRQLISNTAIISNKAIVRRDGAPRGAQLLTHIKNEMADKLLAVKLPANPEMKKRNTEQNAERAAAKGLDQEEQRGAAQRMTTEQEEHGPAQLLAKEPRASPTEGDGTKKKIEPAPDETGQEDYGMDDTAIKDNPEKTRHEPRETRAWHVTEHGLGTGSGGSRLGLAATPDGITAKRVC